MDLQSELGITFMIVTHDQDEAMTMADRIAVMDHGRHRPDRRRRARSTRRRPAATSPTSSATSTCSRAGRRPSTGDLYARDADGRRDRAGRGCAAPAGRASGLVGLRPEKIALSHDEPPQAVNKIAGEIWDIGYLGDWTTYACRSGGRTTTGCARVCAAQPHARGATGLRRADGGLARPGSPDAGPWR